MVEQRTRRLDALNQHPAAEHATQPLPSLRRNMGSARAIAKLGACFLAGCIALLCTAAALGFYDINFNCMADPPPLNPAVLSAYPTARQPEVQDAPLLPGDRSRTKITFQTADSPETVLASYRHTLDQELRWYIEPAELSHGLKMELDRFGVEPSRDRQFTGGATPRYLTFQVQMGCNLYYRGILIAASARPASTLVLIEVIGSDED